MNKKEKGPKDTAKKLDAEALNTINGGAGGGSTNAVPEIPGEEDTAGG